MSHSRFRSNTSVAIAALALLVAACDDDQRPCGPGTTEDTGIAIAGTDVALAYGMFTAGENGDCLDAAVPASKSITITGKEVGGTGFLTLCMPHPQLATDGVDRSIGADQSDAEIQVIGVLGMSGGCTIKFDSASTPTGNGQGLGVCDAGTNPAGFALTLDGAFGITRDCAGTKTPVAITMTGTAIIATQ